MTALLAALIDHPDDEATWLVYRDWLLEQGDPRGELITETDEDRIRAYAQAAMSPRLQAELDHWALVWKRGFIDAVRYAWSNRWPTAETYNALFDDPSAVLLRKIDPRQAQIARCSDALFERPRPSVRELLVHALGDRPFDNLPRLEVLRMIGFGERTMHLAIPTLRSLTADLDKMSALELGRAELPVLEHLQVRDDPTQLLARPESLVNRPPPSWTALALATPARSANVFELLLATPLLGQLRRLEVAVTSSAELAPLHDHRDGFAHLEAIVIELAGEQLDPGARAILTAQCAARVPNATLVVRD